MTTPAAPATAAAPAIAVDAGTRYLRVARIGAGGTPELVDLPGTVPGEGLPTPAGVRGDRAAALSVAYAAYREHCGTPRRMVLVVPPEQRAVPRAGGMPQPRPLGTPHAVLALLRHAGGPLASRLLVCDLGASAADLARCTLVGGAVAVARVARYAPAADGYGAAFDAAVLAGAGLPTDDPAVLHELALARAENARRTEIALDRLAARPDRADRFADTVVHEVAGREITAGVVHRALGLLTEGLDRVLDGLPAHRGARPDPDRTPVIAVGGPARSAALLAHLTARLGRPVRLPDGTDPALAAVFGAALVAGGHADPADRYPHAVAVRVHRTVAGRPRDGELLVSPPGTLEPGGATVFAETGGERVRVKAVPADGTGGREVRIVVRAAGTDAAAPVGAVTVPAAGGGARFHVGVRVAADGTARLVLQPLGPSRPGAHPAQDHLPAELTPEEFLLGVLPIDPRSPEVSDHPPDTQGART